MSDDKKQSSDGYNAEAVQAEIDKVNASNGKVKISKREAALIHALLKGNRQ